jgi:hypothetical protein
MTAVEIVILIIGFFCICISFFLSGKEDGTSLETEDGRVTSTLWTEKEEEVIRERIREITETYQSELVDQTEDRMNRLCNEKIMAIDEFSQQLLEKIETNHQEVVFMYNMLNEKESEVGRIVTKPSSRIAEEKEEKQEEKAVEKPKKTSGRKKDNKANRESEKSKGSKNTEDSKDSYESKDAGEPQTQESTEAPDNDSVNAQIQKMHREGKSVLEISKALNIGQGEVKLVIALYGGRRQ